MRGRTYKGEFGDKDTTVLEEMEDGAGAVEKGRTNGVSLGPHIRASQVKKSDSEMGPGRGGWPNFGLEGGCAHLL